MFKKNITRAVFLSLLFAPFVKAQAQQYEIMEAIPGFFDAGSSISFPDLVLSIYKFGIWTVGIAALFMITVGGFMYATSAGNTSYAGTAKKVITDALLGLVVAMTAYLGLRLINPDLVRLDAFKGGIVSTGAAGIPNVPANAETAEKIRGTGMQALAEEILRNGNTIKLATSGTCKDEKGSAVTPRRNIEEVSQGKPMTVCNANCESGRPCSGSVPPSKAMLEAMLIMAKSNMSYRVTSIAGGQHGKNTSAHYQGKGIDIVPSGGDWNSYVSSLKNNGANGDQTYCEKPGETGNRIKSLTCAVKHHIHSSFVNR